LYQKYVVGDIIIYTGMTPLEVYKHNKVLEMIGENNFKLTSTDAYFTLRDSNECLATHADNIEELYIFLCGYQFAIYHYKMEVAEG